MAPSTFPQLTRRRACQLWGLTLGTLTSVVLFLSWHREQLAPSVTAPTATDRQTITLTDGTFTFLLNRSVYEAHFPYQQLYRCQEVIARDDLCQGPSRAPLLLLAIKSHPASGGRRATLRRTWAQTAEVGGFWLQPLFLLGATSNQKQLELVAQESRVFGDILMWDFVESHHNLSLKERCFLQWVHGHCQRAAFVFKGEWTRRHPSGAPFTRCAELSASGSGFPPPANWLEANWLSEPSKGLTGSVFLGRQFVSGEQTGQR